MHPAEENRPQAALIIPVHNTGAFLLETVESARAQTYDNLAIVVVDDGSTDPETLQVLNQLSHQDLIMVRQENRGTSGARNAGFAAVEAEYVMPLDSDDIIGPEYVARAVDVLQNAADVAVVYGRAELFGDASGEWALPRFDWPTFLVHNLIYCSAMFRASDWIAVGGFDEELREGREYHDFLMKILGRGGRAHRLDTVEFHYRIRSDSKNATVGARRRSLIDAQARIFRNNLAIYEAHAEDLFTFVFRQHDEIQDLKHRYAALERFRTGNPRLIAVGKAFRSSLRRIATRSR